MGKQGVKIEIMDTTLRDGEQTSGVSFVPHEKLMIARLLLEDLKVDRVEVASARVSEGEFEAVKMICDWAARRNLLQKVEVLGFVDGHTSVDWIQRTGCRVINLLPLTLPNRILYFAISYLLICIGIALSNRCGLPIIPTDLFPRELADITGAAYSNIKVSFDVICLAVTAGMTIFFLGHLDGLGIGTILAAFTMGKVIGVIGKWMDGRLRFVSVLTPKTAKPC